MNNEKKVSISVKNLIALAQFNGALPVGIVKNLPIVSEDAKVLITNPEDITWINEAIKKMEDMKKEKTAEMNNQNNGVYHR